MIASISRKECIQEIKNFIQTKGNTAGFCYLRGRRRVGKSTVLELLAKEDVKKVFYFMGRVDEKSSSTVQRCCHSWDRFTENKELSRFRSSELNWDLFFQSLIRWCQSLNNNVLLAFDEIQWIARDQSGFLGSLKQHWIQLERFPHLKILICGSSNKFFHSMTGGEEKLLRGLKTRADIWLQPLTLREIKKYYKPDFTDEELILAYEMIGGVPYYWNQLPTDLNFIQAINKMFFTKKNLFLEEYIELLNLEFQKNSLTNIALILSQIQGSGKTASAISQDAKLADSTVNDLLVKLENYNLVFKKYPLFDPPKERQRGYLYCIKDFYLNFYFRVIAKNKTQINKNSQGELLFANILDAGSKKRLYINDFTGPMFEHLVQYVLETSVSQNENIFKKLHLKNIDFEVGTHWDKTKQIDLIVHRTTDRQLRLIECKWTKDSSQILEIIKNFKSKVVKIDQPFKMFLALNHKPSAYISKLAVKEKITIITPEDLI